MRPLCSSPQNLEIGVVLVPSIVKLILLLEHFMI
jgi:hypothetical protein